MTRLPSSLLVGLLLSPARGIASEIRGEVRDMGNKQPFLEVALVLTSPVLAQQRTTVTDERGGYSFPDLPPGIYILQFEKNAFHPHTRSEILVRLDRTTRVNAELRPLGMPEDQVERPPTIGIGLACLSVEERVIQAVTVERPHTTTDTLRSFQSLRPWIPRRQGI